jgi:hypothetical protein
VHLAFAGKVIGGDWQTGKLYSLDLDYYKDDTDDIESIRQAPHINLGNSFLRFWELWIDMETGVGLDGSGFGSDPQMLLSYSDDGGSSFSNARVGSLGKIGKRQTRMRWMRLGKARDRVWRIAITDPVKRVVIGGGIRTDEAAA